jgi:hypothetical protein
VGRLAPASANNLAHGVGGGGDLFKRNGNDAKEKNLNGGAGGIPINA